MCIRDSGSCVAAGYYYNGKDDQALVDTLAKGTWAVTSSPDASSDNNVMNAVSCLSSSSCVAGGYFYDGSEDQGLIETSSGGTWTLASSPPVTTPTTTALSSSPDPALVSQAVTYTAVSYTHLDVYKRQARW